MHILVAQGSAENWEHQHGAVVARQHRPPFDSSGRKPQRHLPAVHAPRTPTECTRSERLPRHSRIETRCHGMGGRGARRLGEWASGRSAPGKHANRMGKQSGKPDPAR